MRRIPLYDAPGKYALLLFHGEDIKQLENGQDEVMITDFEMYQNFKTNHPECASRLISQELFEKYMKPDIPMWLADSSDFDFILNKKYFNILPKSAEIIPTVNCCFRCEQCSYRQPKELEGLWTDKTLNLDQEYNMSMESMQTIIERLYVAGTCNVVFTGGGEPLVNKDVTLYGIHLAKEKHMNVGLYTNGMFLQEDVCKKICETSPAFIRISVYGLTSVEFERYTHASKKGYDNVIHNIKTLIKVRDDMGVNTSIALSFLVHPILIPDIRKIDEFLDYFTEDELNRLYSIRFTPAVDYFYNNQHDNRYFNDIFEFLQDYSEKNNAVKIIPYWHRLNDLYSKKIYSECYGNGYYAEIGPDGNMYLCCEKLLQKEFCFGNIIQNSIEEIYASNLRKETIDVIKSEHCLACPNLCKPHEINKQIYHVIDFLKHFPKENLIQWRDDLLKIAKSNDSLGKLNAFES